MGASTTYEQQIAFTVLVNISITEYRFIVLNNKKKLTYLAIYFS